MRLRLGLALLFLLLGAGPLSLALSLSEAKIEALEREAAAEAADREADAWRGAIARQLAALESRAAMSCAREVPPGRDVEIDRATGARARVIEPAIAEHGSEHSWTLDRADRARNTIPCAAAEIPRAIVLEVPIAPLLEQAAPPGTRVQARILSPVRDDARAERRILRELPRGTELVRIGIDVPPPRLNRGERALFGHLLLVVVVVVAPVLGWLLGARLDRPLRDLETAAQRIGRGDLAVSLPRGGSAGATFSAFNRMAQELRETQRRAKRAERVAAWRDIARRIAHEIKNPLTPIRMSIETMRRTKARAHPDFDEIFDESTRTVLEEVERMERIVSEFSSFARLPRPRPVELDVIEVVAQVAQLHAPGGAAASTGGQEQIPIALSVRGDVPKVRADRDQIIQVLTNLVQNASEAARSRHGSDGRVEVTVEPLPVASGMRVPGVKVTVSDNGPGIAPEERARVLEPYYTTKASGTGLGLAIVDRIVSDHGGWLEIADSDLGGAAVSFTLSEQGPPDEASSSQTE